VPTVGEPGISELQIQGPNPASRTRMWRPSVLAASSFRSIKSNRAARSVTSQPQLERPAIDQDEPSPAVIEVHGLSKRFGEVRTVDELTFAVHPGTVVGFLGPNGAGKTTTLRMLLGLVRPTAGSAVIDGRRYPELACPLRQVGAVLEASSFHPGRTARNHLRARTSARRRRRRRPDRRGPGAGRTHRRRRSQNRRLLARDAPAPRARDRAAARPEDLDIRRAGQWP
jgi:ABC-type glutathione transport system ATPase component